MLDTSPLNSSLLDTMAIRGRDANLPLWRGKMQTSGTCAYDSVVISGNGIGAAVLAARLNRAPEFAGRVVLAAPPVAESRRLINGVTLRARSIDYYAAALGTSREAVLTEVYGPNWTQATTYRQRTSLCQVSDGSYTLRKPATWMTSDNVRADRSPRAPLAYGVRNSRLAGALIALAKRAGVTHVEENITDWAGLRALAQGSRPLIVNAKPKPLADTDTVWDAPAPKEFVLASQITFTDQNRAAKGVLDTHDAFSAFIHRDGGLDMSVLYPFQDPLSPEARYYGIFYRVMKAGAFDKERECDVLTDEIVGVGETLGLVPHDMAETIGRAAVPCLPWRGLQNRQKDTLDLSYIYSGGAPIITGDGMVRSAVAATAAAEALLEGRNPVPDINRALRRYRFLNWGQCRMMTHAPALTAKMIGVQPSWALAAPGWSRDYDMWAGAY
ncbi:MAG: hypothetical protein COA62_06785 [Rhodobiaceae bacterium]|nr:MAG: hypothetical protein COA62_06785 [Rhodobiaceae bacterium]